MEKALVGEWRKNSTEPCADAYPQTLSFAPNRLYKGEADPRSQLHPVWDVGTWRLESFDRVALSTANDAVVSYGFTVGEGSLEFVDEKGCRIRYTR